MTKDVEHTPICDALYHSAITNEPHALRSYVILWILCVIGALIVLFFWLWLRRREQQFESGYVDKANRSFLYIYKFLIYIYITLVAIQAFFLSLEVILVEYFNIEYNNFFVSLIQAVILTIPHFQMSLIAFLFTKNTLSAKAFTRALKISIPYALLTFIVALLDQRAWLTSVSGNNISTTAVFRVITDLMFECACMFIICRQCQYSWKRKNVILRYLFIVMLITGFDFVAQIFQSGRADGNCITQIGFYLWFIVYPFIFFQTIKDDSDYHWSYATKPLIESTQQSIADLDLFSLPGYHGVHFESTEDKKFRFKKLKQMVSGYVPILAFNKIKFNYTHSCYSLTASSDKKHKSHSNPRGYAHVDKDQTIGAGSTSTVYKGIYKNHPVAVKCLSRLDKKSEMSWTDLTLIFRESILSSSLSHPNVVKFLGASLTYNGFFLVYEYCVYGDLQQILVENSHPNEPDLCTIPQRLYYLLDIAKGMQFLHRSGFVHRDLKTANVVVKYSKKSKRFVGKICDFGVSRKLPAEEREQMNKNQTAHYKFNKSLSMTSDVASDDAVSTLSASTCTPSQGGAAAAAAIGYVKNINAKNKKKNQKHTVSEKQWQRFATRGNTKEITRTIHVGTPAFLAPEILLKLVKSKGVDLDKEKKKQKKREVKRMKEKLKLKEESEKQLNGIDERNEIISISNGEAVIDDDGDSNVGISTPNHYVRGAILDHSNLDPHIYCDYKTDVYSFGMILWSIVTGKLPYKGFKPMDMILMIKNAQRLSIRDSEWRKWENCTEIDLDVEKLKDLLEHCWAQYPYQRPSFEQIGDVLEHIITESHGNKKTKKCMPKVVLDPDSVLTATPFYRQIRRGQL